jgi:cysteine desulfurase/selenocysteine lyase
MTDPWQKVHDAFPIHRRLLWLNNCGTTPPGQHVVDRMHHYFETCSRGGPDMEDYGPAVVRRHLKHSLAQLLHCHPDEIALVHNTAEAMTMVSLGLELEPGDEILLLQDEYPSNVYPWEHWQTRGVKLTFVPLAPTPEELYQGLVERVTSRTRVAAVSAVHWCTGMPLPLPELGRLCQERGIRLVVDGSQGVGHLPLDLGALGPCVVAFSAWKWLLGPMGVGVLAISRAELAQLRPVFKGPDAVSKGSYLPYQKAFKATADRYTYSTANYNDWVYFRASLEFLESLGFARVFARIVELADVLFAGLTALGFKSAYPRWAAPPTGILAVEKPAVDCRKLAGLLAGQGIVARERLGRLRLAPHVYLMPEELERAVQTIGKLADRASA